jgi:hypothetical protein
MSDWPDHVTFDVTLDAFMRRMDRLLDVLVNHGGFTEDESRNILVGQGGDSGSENVSRWLRQELSRLRAAEKIVGEAPVLKGDTLSRLVISDIAMTLVENGEEELGPELIALLMELLDVDRHRRSIAQIPSEQWEMAVQIDAEIPNLGVRKLAKEIGVAPSTLSKWRRDPDYIKKIESIKRMRADPIFKKAFRDYPKK